MLVQTLKESAIICHTYPEEDYIEITLHSCQAIPQYIRVAWTIQWELGLDRKYCLYEPMRNWEERVRDKVERPPVALPVAPMPEGFRPSGRAGDYVETRRYGSGESQ